MICEVCGSDIRDDAAYCPHCGTRVPGGPVYDNYDYEAFISYRHLPRDTKVATRLQRSLEGYRLPRGIRRQDDGATRLGKLFRDQDELPTSQSLGDQIEGALKRSRRLVVVCTPQTGESRWVQREVELFASFHGREAIVIALAAGEPEESFPDLLRGRLVRDGEGVVTRVDEEPIAADFRDGTRKQFNLERLRVASSIIGCGFDELRQRQHARKMRVAVVATSVVAALSMAFGSFSLWQQRQIEENYRQTLIKESESLAVESAELLAQGDRMQAIQVALAALPENSASGDRPLVPAAQLALERALQAYPTESYWRSCYSISDVEGAYAASEDGLQAFLRTDGSILVTSIANGLEVCSFDPEAIIREQKPLAAEYLTGSFSFTFCKDRIIWWNDWLYGSFDAHTGELAWLIISKDGHYYERPHLSEDQAYMAVANRKSVYEDNRFVDYCSVAVFSTEDGKREQVYQLPSDAESLHALETNLTFQIAFSPDGTSLAVANCGHLYLIDLVTGSVATAELQQPYAYAVAFTGDCIVVVSAESSGILEDYITPIDDGAYIDVFSFELKPLWHVVEKPPKKANSQMTTKATRAFIGGVTNDTGDLILAIGYSVIIYDHDTGKEIRRVQTTDPIIACNNLNGSLCYIDGAGNLFFAAAEADVIANQIDHFGLQVSETDRATFSICNGCCLAQWNSATSSYRVYRGTMRYDSFGRESFDGEALIPLKDVWYGSSGPTEKGFLVIATDESLVSIDLETLETQWCVPISSLSEGGLITATGLDDALAVVSEAASDGLCISLLSWDDGSLLDSFEPAVETQAVYGLTTIELDDVIYLLLEQPRVLRAFDTKTHEEVATYAREDKGSMVGTWYAKNSVLTVSESDRRRTFQVISLDSGERMIADIDDCIVPGWAVAPVAVDLFDDGNRFAVVDVAGTVRLYDTQDWTLIWESTELYPKAQHLAFSKDGQYLMLQSLTGSCVLLSTNDGTAAAVSSTTLPPIIESYFIDDDSLVAYYTTDGVRPSFGVSLISLDPQCFGPVDDIFNGVVFTYKKERIFTFDRSADRVVVFHHYTLDELIELGHETIKGHELTDAERYLYRID